MTNLLVSLPLFANLSHLFQVTVDLLSIKNLRGISDLSPNSSRIVPISVNCSVLVTSMLTPISAAPLTPSARSLAASGLSFSVFEYTSSNMFILFSEAPAT